MPPRIQRFELPSSVEEFGEPGTDIFGAAVLRASPDLRLIVAVKVMLLMLHGVISFL
jgi:hypothetical protein